MMNLWTLKYEPREMQFLKVWGKKRFSSGSFRDTFKDRLRYFPVIQKFKNSLEKNSQVLAISFFPSFCLCLSLLFPVSACLSAMDPTCRFVGNLYSGLLARSMLEMSNCEVPNPDLNFEILFSSEGCLDPRELMWLFFNEN